MFPEMSAITVPDHGRTPSGELLATAELRPAELALCKAAATGHLLDLRSRHPDKDDPRQGRSWGEDRRVRAQLLRQLLTGQGDLHEVFGAPVAIRLRGASVVGRLNLGGLKLGCPLQLHDCYLGARLDLAKAEAQDISLRGSYLPRRLSARYLRIVHGLNLTGGFRCEGRADFRGAHLGSLDCTGATLTNQGKEALNADGVVVDDGLSLRNAIVTGEEGIVKSCGRRVLHDHAATLS
jgi:hypothetical protein